MNEKLELPHLGFTPWFAERFPKDAPPDCQAARVTAVNRDSFLAHTETGEIYAEVTGKLLYSSESPADLPCVGDWVAVQVFNQDTLAIIHAVFPRRSWLRRKAAGRKVEQQMIAANVDTAFIVQACGADFNLRRLERYLAMVYEGQIEPVILLTKTDLVEPAVLAAQLAETQAARQLADQAAIDNGRANVQVHGGIGMTDEAYPHLCLKRAHLLSFVAPARRQTLLGEAA